ncbi:unnamed protein product [Rotaria sordida]|uniref:A-kinase anchor protein 14 n=1 Tax=Rotaria sordida TaxID=392033 RepID=A0A814S0B5_9BILA|nr:unnamed protein product [Rotaria sordida]CAF3508100.1 unnamed protein product [Rotaria sordida]
MAVNNIDLPASILQSEDYDLIAYEAQRIVDEVLAQSLLNVQNTTDKNLNENRHNHERGRFIELENDEWQKKLQEKSIVRWPTIAEFTNENIGIEKITEYIEKEWKTTPGGQDACWLYAIDFLEKKSLEFNDLYIYRVRYSIPTRRQPIPRQTVSIYFTLDVSKVKPKNTSIQVSFVLETMRLIHYPDTFRFRQTWLENTILLKEKMTNGIDF